MLKLSYLYSSFILLFLFISKSAITAQKVSVQDSLALVALYDSTGGRNWINSWNLSQPVSTWFGVTLNSGAVFKIDLRANGLKGKLPAKIGNLINLIELRLARNQLNGSIPPQLDQLSRLTVFDLSFNAFTGGVPASLSKLTRLAYFSVERNQLSGSFPKSLGNIINLGVLHLHHNQFTGTIPIEFGNLINLTECYLGNNPGITGSIPSIFNNLAKLKTLGLNHMNLSGSVSSNMGKLTNLETLYLNNNPSLGGALPSELGTLKNLKQLDISSCSFSGAIPASFSNLSLTQFAICFNRFTSLPTMNSSNVNIICVQGNQFTFEDIAAAFNRLPAKVDLIGYAPQDSVYVASVLIKKQGDSLRIDLGFDANVKGSVYTWYKNSDPAKPWKVINDNNKLSFSSLRIEDAGTYRVEIRNPFAPDLTLFSRPIAIQVVPRIDTNACRYRDSLELVKLYNATNGPEWSNKWDLGKPMSGWYGVRLDTEGCVTHIDIKLNRLKGSIYNLNLLSLKVLNLSLNDLIGSIPNFNLPSLELLDLAGNNYLSGNIPNFNLPNLRWLSLSNNQLSGNIPDFNLPQLEELILLSNELTGNIPNFNLPNLKRIAFQNNRLSGNIPNFNLPKLTLLSLTTNQLDGAIPNFNLPNLTDLFLGENRLSGAIPSLLLPALLRLDVSSNQLSGTIPNFNLSKLISLNLENNNFNQFSVQTTLSSLGVSVNKYDSLTIQHNLLTFDDILPNLSLIQKMGSNSHYAPQDSIYRDTTITLQIGQTLNIDLGIDAAITTNSYQWYKNNQIFGSAINSNKFTITNVKTTDAGTYRVRVTNPQAPNLTLVSHSIKLIVIAPKPDTNSCRYRDSLELVKLYNATNGSNWLNKWDLKKPINNWYGVKLNKEGCITCLDLDGDGTFCQVQFGVLYTGNGLVGTLPALNLPQLEMLMLSGNQLSGRIPNLNLPNVYEFHINSNRFSQFVKQTFLNKLGEGTNAPGFFRIQSNKLTFDDIIPNIQIIQKLGTWAFYAPQDSIYRDTTITLQIGQTLNIDLGIDAAITTNSYQWYKNNQIFGSAINSNKFTITNVKTTDAGTYRVRVTNPQAPNLTLVSHSIKLIVIAPKPDTNSCRYRDSLELVKLYNATNGPNWVNKWDLTKPINTWNGISLNAQGCVTNIVLASNKLSGKLPNLNMPELTSLWLVDNQLVGEIPNFNLPKLFRLLLYGNQFSGNIPVFNHTPELSILQLAKNKLTGPIPNFSLPKLTAVILFDNQLSGAIPNLNIPKLQYLALNSNNLTGAVPKFNFPELFDLRLNNNNLTELPEQNTLVKMRDSLLMHTNSFTFDDIIPNLEVITRVGSKAKYAPQKPIVVLDSIRNALVGQSLTINLNIDANLPQDSPNTYTWEKDGKAFMTITGSNKLVFNNLKLSDAGVYTFKVTNPKAPQLTLTGNRIRITVTCTSNTQPIAIKTSRTKICQGDTLKLSVDQTAYTNFRWSNNQTTAVISPNIAQTTTFTVSANDSQGCPTSGTQTISVVPKPKFEIFQVTKNCVDYLELEIDPATKVSRYAWNNQKNSASIQINTPGKYVLTITDVNGCREKDSVTVTSLTKPFTIKDSVIVVPDCGQANGEIWVSASPKTGNYAYQWIPDDVGNGENHRTNLPAGIYTLVVSNPNASCTDSLQLELVTEDCNTELRIFPSFTPNGDNVNETFEIHPLKCSSTSLAECFPNNELLIINRLNHTIFQKAPYNSDWDGENYPVGVYYYIFFPDKNNRKMSLKGWLTLLR